jgi:ArsR family transcriptional regulator
MEVAMPHAERLFRAMADSTRRRLLRVLSENELNVSELVEVLNQPQSTLSRHLKMLREAGLIVDRRRGTTVMSAAAPRQAVPENGTADLRERLVEWIETEPLDKSARTRLHRVLKRRGGGGADFFESVGGRWDQLRIDAFGQAFHFEALTSLLPAEWTVADIGTGTGYLLPLLATRFRRVIAVEPVDAMLAAARQRPELKSIRNVDFRSGSLDDLPIDTRRVDLAIASLVLHHVAEPAEALKELRRIVKRTGRLLVIEQETHENAAFRDRMGDRWWGFEPKALARWVRSAGFAEVEIRELTAVVGTNSQADPPPALFALTAAGNNIKTRADRSRQSTKKRKRGPVHS